MGLAAMFVLIGSNVVISLLKKLIPDKVRIPCFIVVVAGFVTIVQLLMQAYVTPIYEALGVFLPLIVVNCIILARAEVFASKNSVFDSLLDGAGMGIGFTLALVVMATVREVLGAGTWLGFRIIPEDYIISFFTSPAGGFLVFGFMIAAASMLNGSEAPKRKGCAACPSRNMCMNAKEENA
jgi:electron transport complex protein RnfE